MATKLIIVEGLPGSGKSTTAQKVYDILKDKGINSELYSEGNYNHPADFDGVAYFNNEEFNILKQAHSISIDVLNKIKIKYYNGYIIPYRKTIEEQQISFEHELFNDITKNDIYELPLAIHTELILNRWNDFVNNYITEDKVVIFECCFIQNPVTVSMIRNNSPKELTMSYINSLAEKVMPLEPVLIYVEQESIKESFNRVACERPKEWIDGFTYYYTNQGYGLYNNLKGLDGVIEILKARCRLEREIYDSLKLIKYKIDNSAFNLNLLKERINSIIEAHL
jgi:adenylate kinase family enzyme